MTYDQERKDGMKVFRKINSFLQFNVPIHFKLKSGEFRNGEIIDLNESKRTLVLKEDVFGMLPVLLEDIDEQSICERRKKNEV